MGLLAFICLMFGPRFGPSLRFFLIVRPSILRCITPIVLAALTGCGGIGLDPYDTGVMESTLVIDPSGTIDFGTYNVNTVRPARKDVVLYADGGTHLAIIDVFLQDNAAGTFKLPDTLPLPIRLAPEGNFPILLRFNPDDPITYYGELSVLYDDGTAEGAVITRPLQGMGCVATGSTTDC